MTRPTVGLIALALVAVLVGADALLSAPIDPWEVPPPAALGSGQAPAGAHCSAG
ncbi:hypothetical protein CCR87_10405 [Rhodobaculum claviforme]|uniref:Uncharacterized protein n=1 Tax=Rhodobaculum claviforme TaxID=1549854 RepID=A0A934WJP8_9RHOB|nr:hypothetical protein [Rhodobaculum claviforme]